jgi:hypothetical protein
MPTQPAQPLNITNVGVTGTGVKRPPRRDETVFSQEAGAVNPAASQQQNSLNQLNQISATGYAGLDRMAQNRAMSLNERNANSQQAGMMQQAAMRGQAGGSNPFAAAQAAQQGAANRAMGTRADLASNGLNRQFAANQALGGAGTAMQTEAMQRGGANDAFQQWKAGQNAQTKQDTYQYGEDQASMNAQHERAFWSSLLGG